jgi:hypothetical protein
MAHKLVFFGDYTNKETRNQPEIHLEIGPDDELYIYQHKDEVVGLEPSQLSKNDIVTLIKYLQSLK